MRTQGGQRARAIVIEGVFFFFFFSAPQLRRSVLVGRAGMNRPLTIANKIALGIEFGIFSDNVDRQGVVYGDWSKDVSQTV